MQHCGSSNHGGLYSPITATIVYIVPQNQWIDSLSSGIDKALYNVNKGSKLAINNVLLYGITTVKGDEEKIKDQIIDILLDKGYKIVTKEYIKNLDQNGIYTEKTIVRDDKSLSEDYFLNVKITETSLRFQVINISTGEYEGNATISF